MRDRVNLQAGHGQSRVHTPFAPDVRRDEPDMRRVVQFLHRVHPFVGLHLVVGYGLVDEHEVAVGLQHPRRLAHERLWRGEVMRRHPAGDQAKGIIVVGQRLRPVLVESHRQLPRRGEPRRFLQQRRRSVASGDVETMRGESQRGVAVTRCDIESQRALSAVSGRARLFRCQPRRRAAPPSRPRLRERRAGGSSSGPRKLPARILVYQASSMRQFAGNVVVRGKRKFPITPQSA